MDIQDYSSDIKIINLDSYMNSSNLSEFQKVLTSVLNKKIKVLILNFADVIMIDSATIGYLFKVYKQSLEKDFKLKLTSLSDKNTETLSIMGLDRLFDIYDTIKDALDSLKYD